jgi:hypothetical protein
METLKKLIQNNYFIFLLFFFIALLSYLPLFNFTFFQDDFVWISNAKDIWSGKDALKNIFTLKIANFVMPVIYFYFTLAYKIFGINSLWFYLINILLHVTNTFILLKLLKNFFSKNIALTISLVFLTLRYSMESVSWISAITVLITTLFLLSIALLWISILKSFNKTKYFFILLLTLLLIFTKEWSILLLPFLLILTIIYQLQNNKKIIEKKQIFYSLPIGFLFGIYLIIEFFLQSKSSVLIDKGYYAIGWHAIPNIINNIFVTFLPILNIAQDKINLRFTFAIIFLVSTIIFGLYLFFKRKNYLIFGILWMIISFIPTSFFTWNPLVSRYAYIPAIGAVLLIGYGLKYLKDTYNIKLFYIATSFVLLYSTFNVYFTNRALTSNLNTTQKENKSFTQALYQIENKLDKQTDTAIYGKTPHIDFILPEIINTLIDIPTEKIHVINDLEECNNYKQCLFWNSIKKEIEIL